MKLICEVNRFRLLLLSSVLGAIMPMLGGIPAISQMSVPFIKKNLYSASANPSKDIATAIRQAKVGHKRILLDFGGNWCGDCQVLDIYMHQSPNSELMEKYFVLVHVDIGRFDRNLDIAKKYHVPVEKGVPALAVLDSTGNLLFSQRNKEFENMRAMQSSDVTAFLKRWKT